MHKAAKNTVPAMTEEAPFIDATIVEAPPNEEAVESAEIERLAALQADVDKWKDIALRNAAELDNFRKRAARDMQDARAYGNTELLRTLLPILDTFEMGLDAARSEGENSVIYKGLSMVRGQFANFLKEQGVEEINAVAQPFDPNLHEAMMQEAHADAPEGTVIRVMRRGFKLKDRLLRAANVVISSGTPKSEQHAPA